MLNNDTWTLKYETNIAPLLLSQRCTHTELAVLFVLYMLLWWSFHMTLSDLRTILDMNTPYEVHFDRNSYNIWHSCPSLGELHFCVQSKSLVHQLQMEKSKNINLNLLVKHYFNKTINLGGYHTYLAPHVPCISAVVD